MIETPAFRIEMDEEGVCRVVGYEHKTMTFTTEAFGRFLTRFLEVMLSEADEGEETLDFGEEG